MPRKVSIPVMIERSVYPLSRSAAAAGTESAGFKVRSGVLQRPARAASWLTVCGLCEKDHQEDYLIFRTSSSPQSRRASPQRAGRMLARSASHVAGSLARPPRLCVPRSDCPSPSKRETGCTPAFTSAPRTPHITSLHLRLPNSHFPPPLGLHSSNFFLSSVA